MFVKILINQQKHKQTGQTIRYPSKALAYRVRRIAVLSTKEGVFVDKVTYWWQNKRDSPERMPP